MIIFTVIEFSFLFLHNKNKSNFFQHIFLNKVPEENKGYLYNYVPLILVAIVTTRKKGFERTDYKIGVMPKYRK